MQGVQARVFQTRKKSKDRPTVLRMPVDDRALFLREGCLLLQNRVGYPDLSDVVQQRGYFNLIKVRFRNIELAGHTNCPLRQPGAMHTRADVLQIQQLIEGANDLVTVSQVLLFEFFDSHEQRPSL